MTNFRLIYVERVESQYHSLARGPSSRGSTKAERTGDCEDMIVKSKVEVHLRGEM